MTVIADVGTLLVGIAALLGVLLGGPSMRRLHRKADEAAVASAVNATVVASIDHSVNQVDPGAPTLRETAEEALHLARSTNGLVLIHVDQDATQFERIDQRLGLLIAGPNEGEGTK